MAPFDILDFQAHSASAARAPTVVDCSREAARVLVLTEADWIEVGRAIEEIRARRPEAAELLREALDLATAAQPKTLTTSEVASIVGVTPQTVRNWVDRGWIPSRRRHRRGRREIPREALDGLLAFRAANPIEPATGLTDAQIDTAIREHRAAKAPGDPGHGGARQGHARKGPEVPEPAGR